MPLIRIPRHLTPHPDLNQTPITPNQLTHSEEMKNSVIYTEKNNCQDCYKCIKQCPVKAIKVEDFSAFVIPDRCIYCGQCVLDCPVGAKKVRNDVDLVQSWIDLGYPVYACIAPSYLSDFPEVEPQALIAALQNIGFKGVSEVALGAEIVARETKEWLNTQNDGVYLSTCCPSAVEYVCKYHPQLKKHLVPVKSPMLVHSQLLKQLYGNRIKTVFLGPCFAKKKEADEDGDIVDAALSFKEIREWLDIEMPGWTKNKVSDTTFVPYAASVGNFFPVDGGMILNMDARARVNNLRSMAFSGINHMKQIINDIPDWELNGKLFIELMACEGGCINGPGAFSKKSAAQNRMSILLRANASKKPSENTLPSTKINAIATFNTLLPVVEIKPTESQLQNALQTVAKFTRDDELNCGGCGYDSCRDLATAILAGNAERSMCVSYMRRVAHDKASILLKKMPSGVVIVDENLRVIDSNNKFADLLGADAKIILETRSSLEGCELSKLVPFHKLFSAVLQSGEEMLEQDVRDEGRYLHVSVITIQPYKIVCGVIQNMREPEVRKDLVIDRTRQVIRQNMEVVQKIAYLLGENASFTESMLLSILETHDKE
jgi:iron only hydrogenase large subunit-like protein